MTGVYETMRSFKGKFLFLKEHQKRLNKSCKKIGTVAPDLKSIVHSYEGGKSFDYRLKILVSEKGKIKIEHEKLPFWHGTFLYNKIWKIKPVMAERSDPVIKKIKSKKLEKLRQDAMKEGYDEILLINKNWEILEGGITNVFFIRKGILFTPSRGILPGIARDLVIRTAKKNGIKVVKKTIKKDELGLFDAMFLTNSIRGIITVGFVHPVIKKIAKACDEFLRQRANEK